MAERNRLAREMHDVLAHTLGALAIQLEALDARLGGGADAADWFRQELRQTRALAVNGLSEARRAVQALREEVPALLPALATLCEASHAGLEVTGEERTVSPETAHALYRVTQEALTNAAKHAPGMPVAVRLCFEPDGIALAIDNFAIDGQVGELASTGGGFGLEGIRERLRLLGGSVAAGARDDRWVVEARVPG